MKRIISTLALAVASVTAFGQLKVGSVAPDFTLTDINGKSHHLYAYLDSGYSVIIDVSAAWCGPCWSAHNSGVLDNLTTHYGPNGTTSPGKIKVIFIEGESTNTTAQLHGTSSGSSYATYSQGDWVTGTNYPIIDNATQNSNYLYGGFPSFTVICRDRLVALATAGYGSAMGAESWWLAYTGTCPTYAPTSATDAKAVPYTGKEYFLCSATPSVTFQNYSTSNLTSATINIKSGSTVVKTQTWTGTLAPYGLATVAINSFTPTQFAPFKYEVVASGDANAANNTSADSAFKVYNASSAQTTPWSENFESSANFSYKMAASDDYVRPFSSSGSYVLTGPNGANGRALMFPNPEVANNTASEVVLGNFNSGTAANVALDFDLSYANSSGKTDKIEVFVSNNCGAWTSVWSKSGAALSTTAPPASGAFVPTAANMWRHESVNLTANKGSNFAIKMVGTSNQGHYAFVDNLKVTNTTGVENVINNGTVKLYPNPAKENAALEFTLAKNGTVVVNVLDATGRTVATVANGNMTAGAQHVNIPTAALAAGVYSISIQTEEGTLTQRLSVVK
jgi:hypothetical protein